MKAAVVREVGVLEVGHVPDPQLAPGDMLIRMRAAAICGTDIRVMRGRKTAQVRFPTVLGHEFSGEVVETGGHAGWHAGDRVAVNPSLACGTCESCRRGLEHICDRLVSFGYGVDGGFAELVRLPSAYVTSGNVVRLPPHVSFRDAALAEPLACCINGQDLAQIGPADHVAILGAGPIGLLHVMLARSRGVQRITVVQRSAHRRQAALDLGADAALAPDEAANLGVDVAIVAVGSVELAALATRIVRKHGRINLFAGFPVGEAWTFDLNAIHYREQFVSGASGLSRAHYQAALDLISGGSFAARRIVSSTYGLDEGAAAFAAAEQGSALKVVIENG